MREKLQTLPLAELRELARSQGLKGISALRKAEIIDLLCQKEESGRENSGKENSPAASPSRPARTARAPHTPRSRRETETPGAQREQKEAREPRDTRE